MSVPRRPRSGIKISAAMKRLAESRRTSGAFRAHSNTERRFSERMSERLIRMAGSMAFLSLHLVLFVIWLSVNLQLIPGIKPWDPFPLGLLTMILTLEQSLLAIFIIISQNRASEMADLRNEIDLQVNMVTEEEITKALTLLRLIGEKLNIEEIINDAELRAMEKRTDLKEIEHQTQDEADGKANSS